MKLCSIKEVLDNQKQHLFLGQRRFIGNMMWM